MLEKETATDNVTVQVFGQPRRRREVNPGQAFTVTVPVTHNVGVAATPETSTVDWTIEQTSEPETVKAHFSLRLARLLPPGCALIAARMSMTTEPH